MLILGIESSCDETSCSVVRDGTKELYTVVSSSSELHEKTGGIVPEIAARKQVEYILPVISEVVSNTCSILNISREEFIQSLDAVAVTIGPGLIGSLIVGVEAAKALSISWQKPVIPVNHLVGHIYANFLEHTSIEFPAVALVVSGGHTDLVLMKGHGDFEYLGGTVDDAAGEAFDKTARLLGLSNYKLGGPAISKKASEFKVDSSYKALLPRPKITSPDLDFSFSGLKTAVKYMVAKNTFPTDRVAYDFESAIIEVLVKKTTNASIQHNAKCVLLGGGVVANKKLREEITTALNMPVYFPSVRLCGDNAAYIASAANFINTPKDLNALRPNPSLSIIQ